MGKRKRRGWFIPAIVVLLLLVSFLILLYKTHFIKPPPPPIPEIAIIIDDFGYEVGSNVKEIISLPYPITIAIIPNAPYSERISLLAKEEKKEVILHLPMEPKDYPNKDPGKGAIFCKMSTMDIKERVRRAIESLPYLQGVNNHMGSKATEDLRVMEAVLGVVKERDLYFVDSLTTESSVAGEVASKTGTRFLSRDIFLDNKDDPLYINRQFDKLIEMAKENGKAVGIGHIHLKSTISVLKQRLPQLQREGVRLVFASTLVDSR
jgi:hypothetical protein